MNADPHPNALEDKGSMYVDCGGCVGFYGCILYVAYLSLFWEQLHEIAGCRFEQRNASKMNGKRDLGKSKLESPNDDASHLRDTSTLATHTWKGLRSPYAIVSFERNSLTCTCPASSMVRDN